MSMILSSAQPATLKGAIAGGLAGVAASMLFGRETNVPNVVVGEMNVGVSMGLSSAIAEFGSEMVSNIAGQYLPQSLIAPIQSNAPVVGALALQVALTPQFVQNPMRLLQAAAIFYGADYVADMIIPSGSNVSNAPLADGVESLQ